MLTAKDSQKQLERRTAEYDSARLKHLGHSKVNAKWIQGAPERAQADMVAAEVLPSEQIVLQKHPSACSEVRWDADTRVSMRILSSSCLFSSKTGRDGLKAKQNWPCTLAIIMVNIIGGNW